MSVRMRLWLFMAVQAALALCCLLIVVFHHRTDYPKVEHGFLDLSEWPVSGGAVPLNGTWSFYPDQLLTPDDFLTNPPEGYILNVPSSWNKQSIDGKLIDGFGHGTYRLVVMLPRDWAIYALKMPTVATSARVWANGQLIREQGVVGDSPETTSFQRKMDVVTAIAPDGRLEIVYQVANYYHRLGGLWSSVWLGSEGDIGNLRAKDLMFVWLIFGAFMVIAFYHLCLFIQLPADRSLLWFSVFCLALGIRSVLVDDCELGQFFPSSFAAFLYRLEYTCMFVGPLALIKFLEKLFHEEVNPKITRLMPPIWIALAISCWLLPAPAYSYLKFPFLIVFPPCAIYFLGVVGRAILANQPGSIPLFTGLMAGALGGFMEALIYYPYLSSLSSLLLIWFQAFVLSSRSSKAYRTLSQMSHHLEEKNRELANEEKLKDEFLANTSHELRTPLNGIIGLAESLLDSLSDKLSDHSRKDLSMIVSGGRRLSGLVNDVLDFSRLEHHELVLARKRVDLRAMVDVVFTLARPLASGKRLLLYNEVSPHLPSALADEERLQQILFNLVSNGIKFTETGNVTVSARQVDGDRVEITITDTGVGIEPNRLKTIFDRYWQKHGEERERQGQAGLGLTLVRQLVELHGGQVWAFSGGLDKGSMFGFSLPLETGNSQVESYVPQEKIMPAKHDETEIIMRPYQEDDETESFKILVVDDEPVNRMVLVNYLSPKYRVGVAADGRGAIKALEEETFDMVLLDVMMPLMNGYEVCREIRQKYSIHELPVIYLSAKSQASDVVQGFECGGNDYINKPIVRQKLLARVSNHLEIRDISQNLERKVTERTEVLQKHRDVLERLDKIAVSLNREMHLEGLLERILAHGADLCPLAEAGIVLMFDNTRSCYVPSASFGEQGQAARSYWRKHELAVYNGVDPILEGIYAVPCREGWSILDAGFFSSHPKSVLVMEFLVDGRLSGLLILGNFTNMQAFDDADAHRLGWFREHVSAALTKLHYMEMLRAQDQRVRQSITFARQIQLAMLPSKELLTDTLGDHFVFFKPRDPVSGDFYWAFKANDKVMVAVVDCTGHGVPGAFMSMIGHMYLNDIVMEKKLYDPANILGQLHREVRRALKQEQTLGASDGMDMSLCSFDGHMLCFAGAVQSLFLVRAKQKIVTVIKGNRASIGGRQKEARRNFANQRIAVHPGDMVYLVTDGFADQHDENRRKFGTPRLKKLLAEISDLPPSWQRQRLKEALALQTKGVRQRDDITILGWRIPGREIEPRITRSGG